MALKYRNASNKHLGAFDFLSFRVGAYSRGRLYNCFNSASDSQELNKEFCYLFLFTGTFYCSTTLK